MKEERSVSRNKISHLHMKPVWQEKEQAGTTRQGSKRKHEERTNHQF